MSETGEMLPPVVIDNGSGIVKLGFSGDDCPRSIFPSLVGLRKTGQSLHGVETSDIEVGDRAARLMGVMQLKYPIVSGRIVYWEYMYMLWEYAYMTELRIQPDEHRVMLTVPPENPAEGKAKMIMWHLFECNPPFLGAYISIQATLAIYASGRTTGLIIDTGDGVSHVVPCYQGYPLPQGIGRLDCAGRDLTNQMRAALRTTQAYSFENSSGFEIVKACKESVCYVAEDLEKEEEKRRQDPASVAKNFQLPDGNDITLTWERYTVPEALFNPDPTRFENGGIPDLIWNSIQQLDIHTHKELLDNLIYSGGTSMLPNIGKRTTNDLLAKPVNCRVKVMCPPERGYSVWIGGSVLASLSTFEKAWVTPDRVNRDGIERVVAGLKC